jgi:hypothetical protein
LGGIGDDRVRLHHRRDSLRWLRNEQRSCRCDCERTKPQKSVHLQLLARADGPFRFALARPGSRPSPISRHFVNPFFDLDQLARSAKTPIMLRLWVMI